MADNLFIDDAGQVFRKTSDGYQFVSKAPPKPEAPPEAAIGNGFLRGSIRGLATPADLVTMLGKAFTSVPADAGHPSRSGGFLPPQPGRTDALKDTVQGFPMPSETLSSVVDRPPPGAGRYVEEATAGATGAALFPGSVGPKLVAGAAGGMGGELAANLFKDNSPIARVTGAILTSVASYPALQGAKLIASMLGGRSTETPKMVSEAARGLTEADWQKAVQTALAAQKAGVRVTPAQAVEAPSGLPALQDKVAASPQGAPTMGRFLRGQNEDAASSARGFLGGVSPQANPEAAALSAQRAADAHITTIDKGITKQVNPYYKTKPDTITGPSDRWTGKPATPMNVADATVATGAEAMAARIAKGADVATEAGEHIQALADRVAKAKSVAELNTIYNETKQGLSVKTLNTKSITDYTAGQIKERGLKVVDEMLGGLQVDRTGGKELYHNLQTGVADPARRSLTGQIATPRGVVEDVPTATTRILNLMDSPNVRAQSILKTQQDFARAGQPEAFPAMVRAGWEKKLEAAFKGESGVSAADSPAKFASSIWGSTEQTARRENFRATMAGVARSNGSNEGEVVKGAENLMRVMEAAGRGKSASAAFSPPGGPMEAAIARVGPGSGNSMQVRLISRIDSLINGKAYGEIAQLLTSPEGMKELREFAKFNLSAYRTSTLSGTAASSAVEANQGD